VFFLQADVIQAPIGWIKITCCHQAVRKVQDDINTSVASNNAYLADILKTRDLHCALDAQWHSGC